MAAPTYLGELSRNGQGAGSIDLTSYSLQDEDVVVVFDSCASNANSRNVGVSTSGYTNVAAKISANDTYDCNSIVAWKRMGPTPDTSVAVVATGNSTDARRTVVRAYRGVDPTTFLDVAEVTTTGVNGLLFDSNAITPATLDALIIIYGMGATVNGSTTPYSAPSDLVDWTSNYTNSGSFHCVVGVGHKVWASGAFNPDAWTGPTSNTTDSRAGWAIALKPAAASGSVGSSSGAASSSAVGAAEVRSSASAAGASGGATVGAAEARSALSSSSPSAVSAVGAVETRSALSSSGLGSSSLIGAKTVATVATISGSGALSAVTGEQGSVASLSSSSSLSLVWRSDSRGVISLAGSSPANAVSAAESRSAAGLSSISSSIVAGAAISASAASLSGSSLASLLSQASANSNFSIGGGSDLGAGGASDVGSSVSIVGAGIVDGQQTAEVHSVMSSGGLSTEIMIGDSGVALYVRRLWTANNKIVSVTPGRVVTVGNTRLKLNLSSGA